MTSCKLCIWKYFFWVLKKLENIVLNCITLFSIHWRNYEERCQNFSYVINATLNYIIHNKKICEVNMNYHFDNSCLLQEQWIFICLCCLDFFNENKWFFPNFHVIFQIKNMVPWFQNCGKKIECKKHEKKVLKKLNK